MAMLQALKTRYWPPVPAEIRDELAVLRYARLQQQIPILYLTLIAVVLTAMLAATSGAPWWARVGIPLFLTGAGVVRFAWWMGQRGTTADADTARRHMRRMILISTGICTICSIWCITSWLLAAPEHRSYYPTFMAMGSLTTAFSLAVIRFATVSNLALGIAPITLAMTLFGNYLDRVAAMVVVMATLFMIRMVAEQHRQLVDLLLLKHQLREQANTDPLTGLLNRRALIASAEQAFGDYADVGLALIDLDGFKAVNDRHGHAAGDALLVQIAGRMRRVVGEDAVLARLGGDEFALLLMGSGPDALKLCVDHLLAALAPPFIIGSAQIALGASAGMANAPHDGRSLTELFASADSTLYAAKDSRDLSGNARRRANRAAA
ncbi:MAG: diguanylate cyclase [Sphingopyxis sp.]|nr:diguanylate cyclase [Sphingopyxis sp.]